MTERNPRIDLIAKAICAETCAFMGEAPCYRIYSEDGELLPWPPAACDEPGCIILAMAVIAVDGETGAPAGKVTEETK